MKNIECRKLLWETFNFDPIRTFAEFNEKLDANPHFNRTVFLDCINDRCWKVEVNRRELIKLQEEMLEIYKEQDQLKREIKVLHLAFRERTGEQLDLAALLKEASESYDLLA